jgi:DNA-binding MarR family transcriptional regulator
MTDSSAAGPDSAPAGTAPAGTALAGTALADGAAAVGESFIGLMRTVRRAKARLLDAAGNDIDSASQVLLHTVHGQGPMRASALAASLDADLSTVSRQVTTLVGRGLLERQADQDDGRATLLAVTSAGRAAIARHEQGRQAFFEAVLSGWTAAEMGQFAQQLERFTAAYDQVHTHLLDTRSHHTEETEESEEGFNQ